MLTKILNLVTCNVVFTIHYNIYEKREKEKLICILQISSIKLKKQHCSNDESKSLMTRYWLQKGDSHRFEHGKGCIKSFTLQNKSMYIGQKYI